MPHFECGAFNRSATSPRPKGRAPRSVGRYVANAVQRDKRSRELDGHSAGGPSGASVPELRGAPDGRLRPTRSLDPAKLSPTGMQISFTEAGCED
jgi:hypothetical protein